MHKPIRVAFVTVALGWSVLFTPASPAAPDITSAAGTFVHKSPITISGSGFGVKSEAAPFKWDDFENGIAGNQVSSKYEDDAQSKSPGEWINYRRSRGPLYAESRAHGGNKSAHVRTQVREDFHSMGIKGLNATEVYASVYLYFERIVDGGGTPVHKLLRINGTLDDGPPGNHGPGCFYFCQPRVAQGMVGGTGYMVTMDNGAGYNSGEKYTSPAPPAGQWNRLELYAKLSDPAGAANGVLMMWTNLIYNVLPDGPYGTGNPLPPDTWVTLGEGVLARYDGILMPGMVDTKDDVSVWDYYIDDVYIDTTRARVEICDASTWSARTRCEIQPPSAWSATAITATVNRGAFACGQQAYLYVVDADGNANANGFPVTLCSGGDMIAPAAPTNLTVQ